MFLYPFRIFFSEISQLKEAANYPSFPSLQVTHPCWVEKDAILLFY
jgi:hypothetical protein